MESDIVEIIDVELELNKRIKEACKKDRSHTQVLNQ